MSFVVFQDELYISKQTVFGPSFKKFEPDFNYIKIKKLQI